MFRETTGEKRRMYDYAERGKGGVGARAAGEHTAGVREREMVAGCPTGRMGDQGHKSHVGKHNRWAGWLTRWSGERTSKQPSDVWLRE